MKRNQSLQPAGFILIGLGFLCNEWLLAQLLSSDHSFRNGLLRFAIWAFDISAVLVGMGFAFKLLDPQRLLKAAKSVAITAVVTLLLLFLADALFGVFYPIKPWEKEENIMGATSYITQPYYNQKFMWEQDISSKYQYWNAPSDTRLVFKKEYHGQYINTEPLVCGSKRVYRRTINQYPYGAKGVKTVLMLGGSTLYCAETPDSLTISSQVAKALNATGKDKYHVVNAGVVLDSSLQELERLKLELKAGLRPDLVIGYHGFNDILMGVYLNSPDRSYWESIIRNNTPLNMMIGLLQGNLSGNIYSRLRLEADKRSRNIRIIPPQMHDNRQVLRLIDEACAAFVANNREMGKLARQYGFKYYSILQPVAVYGKYPADALDISLVKAWGDKNQPLIFPAYEQGYPVFKVAMQKLKGQDIAAYDCSELLLTKRDNFFVDICHLNGSGNRRVAETIAKIVLEPAQ